MTTCFCGASASTLMRERIRGGKARDIVRCERCGAVRKDDLDTDAHEEFHEEGRQTAEIDLDSMSEAYEERNLVDVERRTEAIAPLLDGDESVLDFGTGMGYFLEAIDPHAGEVVGSEINRERVAFIRQELGYDVHEGLDPLLSSFEDGHFDVVTMFHVLEHLPDPVEHLRSVRRLLADDGLLIVEVPNHDDWLLRASDAYRDFYYQDAHAYYFDPKTLHLAFVMAEFGPDVSGVQRYSYRNALNWIRQGEPELDAPSRHRDSWSDPVDRVYAEVLDAVGRSDTLWAVAEPV